MDEWSCDFWLDPIEITGTKKEGVHPFLGVAKREAEKQRASERGLERCVVNCQTGADSVSNKENRAKGQDPREQVALVRTPKAFGVRAIPFYRIFSPILRSRPGSLSACHGDSRMEDRTRADLESDFPPQATVNRHLP